MELYINIGRFHPLLVHLPIGILLFAFLLEGMKRWNQDNTLDRAIQLALLAGAVFAVASAATGLWLSNEGGYDEAMLSRHKWAGIALAGVSVLLYFAHSAKTGAFSKFYTPLFLGAMGLLLATGHLGGNITHGSDFLFSNPEDAAVVVADIAAANTFETIIEPILKSKCNSCHNPSKAKGELVMTSREGLLAGGKNGPVFNGDIPLESEFLKRMHLPESEKKHMPPKGKKQLSGEEVQLLEWWVKNKACFDCIVQSMEGNETVQPILDKYSATSTNLAAIRVAPVKEKTLEDLNAAGLRVYPLAEGSPLLIVNLSHNQSLNASTLKKLRKIRKNIVELNLSHSNFSDELSGILSKLANLTKLQLQKTGAGDETLRQLENLQYLESLNIYGTAVTDAAIDQLKAMPALQHLYSWQSALSEEAIGHLQEARPLLDIQHQLDESLFGESKLNPPAIEAGRQLFVDTVVARLVSNFRNTSIYYTLDGTEPDTCSTPYADSIVIRQSAVLKAFTHKAGWEDSPVGTQRFVKAGIKAQKATLAEPPHEKYKANGAASLIDLEKGSALFTNGNWLGYEGKNMTVIVELKQEEELKEIAVSALSAPASWIFFPKGIKVWLSGDGQNYRMAREVTFPPAAPSASVDLQFFTLAFEPTKAKFIKVEAVSPLKNPDWHPAPGEKCWIFIDEILVN